MITLPANKNTVVHDSGSAFIREPPAVETCVPNIRSPHSTREVYFIAWSSIPWLDVQLYDLRRPCRHLPLILLQACSEWEGWESTTLPPRIPLPSDSSSHGASLDSLPGDRVDPRLATPGTKVEMVLGGELGAVAVAGAAVQPCKCRTGKFVWSHVVAEPQVRQAVHPLQMVMRETSL